MMLVATLLFCLFALQGSLQLWNGVVMLSLLTGYLAYSFWADRQGGTATAELHVQEAKAVSRIPARPWLMSGFVVIGLGALIGGAQLLVNSAVAIAEGLGVSAAVIGLTLVAVGTSLPELAVSVMASLRRQAEVSIGNILGSNIFNLLGILGVTALIDELPLTSRMINFDQWVMLAAAGLLFLFVIKGKRLSRLAGAAFLVAYAMYLFVSFVGLASD